MKIIVQMRDNYTRYRIPSRSKLSDLLTREAETQNRGIVVEVRYAHDSEWRPRSLRYLNRHAIASVAQADDTDG